VLDASLDLLPAPAAAGAARRWSREVLAARVGDDTVDAVELVLTELVQNAVFHANTPMTVQLRTGDDDVLVRVADGSAVLPSSGLTDAEAMSGRGLLMVAAVASGWGAEARPGGKVVWARVPHRPDAGAGAAVSVEELLERWSDDGERTPLQRTDRSPLVVRDLPTDTMLAVKTHNDDVLRELTLCAMADEGQGSGPEADVSRLARRARTVLASFADGRQQVRNQVLSAVHDGRATFDLTLAVDDRALAVLDEYLDVLEEADEHGARGLLLTEPPGAEVLAVRRLYLTQLLAQLQDR
jgi:hypothetical protein